MKSKTIYFSVLVSLFFVGIYCILNLDTAIDQKFLFPYSAISLFSWTFSLVFLKAFVKYEERKEEDRSLRSIYEFIAGAISAFTGFILFAFIWRILDWEYSILFANIVPLFTSMFICTLTGIPEDPYDKDNIDRKKIEKNRSDHGVYS